MTTARMQGAHRRLWGSPGFPALVALAFLARLPLGMTTVGLLLFVRQTTGTFAVAGLAVAAFAVSAAVSSPTKGALLDRVGHRPVLAVTAAVMAGGLAATVWLRPESAGAAVALGAAIGIGMPPVSAAVRAGFADSFDGDRLRAAYSVDAVTMELVYLGGPVLVGLVITLGGTSGTALLLAAALAAGATLGFAALTGRTATAPAERPERHVHLPLGRPVRFAIAAAVPQAAALGLGEVVVSAAAIDAGRPAAVGPLLGAWAAGSIAGGIAFGALRWSWSPGRQYAVLLSAVTVGLALLAVPDSLLLLGIVLFLAGLPTSAAWAAGAAVVAGAPPSQRGRAYGWLQGTVNAGAAAGYALGGSTVGWSGLELSYLLAAGLAALAAGAALGIGGAGSAAR